MTCRRAAAERPIFETEAAAEAEAAEAEAEAAEEEAEEEGAAPTRAGERGV